MRSRIVIIAVWAAAVAPIWLGSSSNAFAASWEQFQRDFLSRSGTTSIERDAPDAQRAGAPPAEGGQGARGETDDPGGGVGEHGTTGLKKRTKCKRTSPTRKVCTTRIGTVPIRRCTYRKKRGKWRRTCVDLRLRTGSLGGDDATSHRLHAARLTWQGWPSPTSPPVGKIFAEFPDGRMFNCSGTVVTQTLVFTAGHCIYNPSAGGYASQVGFVPGGTYDGGGSITHPYGGWYGSRWWTTSAYYYNDDPSLDWGLLELGSDEGGRYVGDVTGSWSITPAIRWNSGARVYAMGYPASGFWAGADGQYGFGQYACDTEWDGGYWTIGSGYEIWSECTMNGGASGGPWFVLLSDNTWTIGGVNNRCHGPNMERSDYCQPYSYFMRASYIDNRFYDFWNSVVARR